MIRERMDELWKTVPGWPAYAVSNLGRLKRLAGPDAAGQKRKERLIKVCGRDVSLCSGKRFDTHLARLVLLAFVGPPPSPEENNARHLDDNFTNNLLTNLAWGSKKDNAKDAMRNGRLICSDALRKFRSDKMKGNTYSRNRVGMKYAKRSK